MVLACTNFFKLVISDLSSLITAASCTLLVLLNNAALYLSNAFLCFLRAALVSAVLPVFAASSTAALAASTSAKALTASCIISLTSAVDCTILFASVASSSTPLLILSGVVSRSPSAPSVVSFCSINLFSAATAASVSCIATISAIMVRNCSICSGVKSIGINSIVSRVND